MTLDTNILIAYFKDQTDIADTIEFWKRNGKSLFISTISQTEILSYAQLSSKEVSAISNFLASFLVVSYDAHLANIAAFFRREYKLTLPDAAIVATAVRQETPLVTRDKKLFRISELTVIKI